MSTSGYGTTEIKRTFEFVVGIAKPTRADGSTCNGDTKGTSDESGDGGIRDGADVDVPEHRGRGCIGVATPERPSGEGGQRAMSWTNSRLRSWGEMEAIGDGLLVDSALERREHGCKSQVTNKNRFAL